MRAAYYTRKDLKKEYSRGVKDAIDNILQTSVHILDGKFGFTKDQIDKFVREFNNIADSCVEDLIDMDDIKRTNAEEGIYGGSNE